MSLLAPGTEREWVGGLLPHSEGLCRGVHCIALPSGTPVPNALKMALVKLKAIRLSSLLALCQRGKYKSVEGMSKTILRQEV